MDKIDFISKGKWSHGGISLYSSAHRARRKKYGEFRGTDKYTTAESERLARLPLYYGLSEQDQSKVIDTLKNFYKGK